MQLVDFLIKFIAVSIIILQAFILVVLVFLVSKKLKSTKSYQLLSKYCIHLAFFIALCAALGSLYFSEIVGMLPCTLCWYQRILLYPQAIILGVAIFYSDENVRRYIIPLCIIGIGISAYQYYTQFAGASSIFCSSASKSCASIDLIEFGYITIPLMSLTAFVQIILLMLFKEKAK